MMKRQFEMKIVKQISKETNPGFVASKPWVRIQLQVFEDK